MSVGRCRWGVVSVMAACLTGPVIAAPSGDPILIGVMGGTTGAYGNVGTQAQQGALVAQEKLTAQGGILGRPVVVEAVNDNGDGTLAGQLFQKFVSKGAVAIVGSPDNGPVTAQLADRYHILDIGLVDGGGLTVYPNGPDKPPHAGCFNPAPTPSPGARRSETMRSKTARKALRFCTTPPPGAWADSRRSSLRMKRRAKQSPLIARSRRTGRQAPQLSWRPTLRR